MYLSNYIRPLNHGINFYFMQPPKYTNETTEKLIIKNY